MELNSAFAETTQELPITFLLLRLAKFTLLNTVEIDALARLLELINHLIDLTCLFFFLWLLDLLSLLLFLVITSHIIKVLLNLPDASEWEVVFLQVFQESDVVLHVEHGKIARRL